MKRSEALNLIANQLDFLNGKFSGCRINFTKEELSNADVILTTLEHSGMLPPRRLSKTWKDLDIDDILESEVPKFYINKWEPESDLNDSLNKLINEEGWDDVETHADGVKSARK